MCFWGWEQGREPVDPVGAAPPTHIVTQDSKTQALNLLATRCRRSGRCQLGSPAVHEQGNKLRKLSGLSWVTSSSVLKLCGQTPSLLLVAVPRTSSTLPYGLQHCLSCSPCLLSAGSVPALQGSGSAALAWLLPRC